MDHYKPTISLDPTDNYEKAKQDLLQALKSCSELNPQQKECLVKEIFGAANVAFLCNILNQHLR